MPGSTTATTTTATTTNAANTTNTTTASANTNTTTSTNASNTNSSTIVALTTTNSSSSATSFSNTCNSNFCNANTFANLTCLQNPVQASDLKFCKQLNNKNVCCSLDSINNIGNVIRALLGNFTERAIEVDSALNETRNDEYSANGDLEQLDSTVNDTATEVEDLDQEAISLEQQSNSTIDTNTTNSTTRRFLRFLQDSNITSTSNSTFASTNSSNNGKNNNNRKNNNEKNNDEQRNNEKNNTQNNFTEKSNNQRNNTEKNNTEKSNNERNNTKKNNSEKSNSERSNNTKSSSSSSTKKQEQEATKKSERVYQANKKKDAKSLIKSILNLKNLNIGLLKKKLPVQNVQKTFVHFQQIRRKCFNFIFELASKFSCMACFNAEDQQQFFQNGTLKLDSSVCSNISHKCADYITHYGNISQLIQNQQNIQQMYDLIKRLNKKIKELRIYSSQNDYNSTILQEMAQNVTNLYNQALQIVHIPFRYKHVERSRCQSNNSCNYSCENFISASTGGINFETVEDPGTTTTINATENETRRVLATITTTFEDGKFDPQTQVTSGLENSISFQLDPSHTANAVVTDTSSSYSNKLFSSFVMLILLVVHLLFLN